MKKSWFVLIAAVVLISLAAVTLIGPKGEGPESDMEKFLRLYLQERWHPPSYKAIFDENKEYGFSSFGGIYSNNYFENWVVDNCYFLAVVGYSKPTIYTPYEGKQLGFALHVAVPYPQLKAKELAWTFLKGVPRENWKHAGPTSHYSPGESSYIPGNKSECAGVWWQTEKLKHLLYVTLFEKMPGWFQDLNLPPHIKTEEKVGIITYKIYTPYEPLVYGEVETYLVASLHVFGGENIREEDP